MKSGDILKLSLSAEGSSVELLRPVIDGEIPPDGINVSKSPLRNPRGKLWWAKICDGPGEEILVCTDGYA